MKFSIIQASTSITTGLYHQLFSTLVCGIENEEKLSQKFPLCRQHKKKIAKRIVKFIYKGNRFCVTQALFADIAFSDFLTSFRCPKLSLVMAFSSPPCRIHSQKEKECTKKIMLTVNFNFQGFFSA